jgi:hypothetical protein
LASLLLLLIPPPSARGVCFVFLSGGVLFGVLFGGGRAVVAD